MKNKRTLIILLASICFFLIASMALVVWTDPFMQYHKPSKGLFLTFDNARYQNDGIARWLDYDSIITGTSLTENFRASQFDNLFEARSIKVPYSGATFYEGARIVDISIDSGHQLKYVLRSFDLNHMIEDKNLLRDDLGDYPEYLRNDSIWDDYRYILNKDVVVDYVFPMLKGRILGREGGYTDFDEYLSWRGRSSQIEDIIATMPLYESFGEFESLTAEERDVLIRNIEQNIVDLAINNPNTVFIYYVAPYNGLFWGDACRDDIIKKYYEAQKLAFEKMLECPNIRIYSYTNDFELTMNRKNYSDTIHYMYFVNDKILEWIARDEGRMTEENYLDYLDEQYAFYSSVDYNEWLGLTNR